MGRPKGSSDKNPTRPTRGRTLSQVQKKPRTLAKLHASTLTSAFNYLEGGWRHYLDFIRMSAEEGDPDMKRLLSVHDGMTPRERSAITPEQLCERSNVKVEDLVGEVARQLWRAKNFEAGIITALNHPKIIAKTAKSALGNSKAAGFDRTNFLKGTGFLPAPRFGIFNNNTALPPAPQTPERAMLPSHAEEIGQLDSQLDGSGVEDAEIVDSGV